MKILHIVPTYLPAYRYGGPIYSVHELNKWLIKSGVEVTVYTTNIDGPSNLPVKIDDIDGVKICYFQSSFPRRWFYSRDLRNALRSNIQHFNMVHITSVFLSASYLGAKYARKAGVPYIISPRGSLIPALINKKSSLLKKNYIKLIESKNLLNASAIHFTTEYEQEEYLKLELPQKKAIIIPNGVEIIQESRIKYHELREILASKFNVPINSKIILSLGRLNWKKGFDTLIPAFADVAKQEPNTVLVIAGSDSDDPGYKNVIEKLIEKYQINNNIRFTGDLRDDDKLIVYQSANIFVMPSHSENFGLSAVEAMAESIPVIVTDTVGVASDIKQAKAGVVIKKDINELTKAIIGLLRDEELCRALGERGIKLVREKYVWPEIAKKWIEEYTKLMES